MIDIFKQKYRRANKHIFVLALPSMIALIAEPLLGLVDTALVGNLGTIELGALAIITTFLSGIIWMFNFFVSGTTANIAQLFGQNNVDGMKKFFLQSLTLGWMIGVGLALMGYVIKPFVFQIMGASKEIIEIGNLYYLIRLIGFPFIFTYFISMGFLRGVQDMKTPMKITIIANLGNAIADYVLIYGIPGVMEGFGLIGAAIATVSVQILSAFWYLVVIYKKYRISIDLFSTEWFDLVLFKKLIVVNQHLFFRTLFLLSSFMVATAIAARMGEPVLAAHQIGMQLWLFCSFALDSFAIAGQAITGKFIGQKLPGIVHQYSKLLISWNLLLGLFFGFVFLVSGDLIFNVFTNDHQVLVQLNKIFWFIVLFQPFNGIIFALDGIFIGTLDTKFLMVQLFIASVLVYIPISLISLHSNTGITGIWIGLTLFLLIRLVMNLYRFHSKKYLSI
ncbi:MAG: MATE family efflux transporter [Calditrichia bacterium]